MLCILHGYLLEGSGSNLWTRCVVVGAAVLIIVLGILPNSVVRWTERSRPSIAKPAGTVSLQASAAASTPSAP